MKSWLVVLTISLTSLFSFGEFHAAGYRYSDGSEYWAYVDDDGNLYNSQAEKVTAKKLAEEIYGGEPTVDIVIAIEAFQAAYKNAAQNKVYLPDERTVTTNSEDGAFINGQISLYGASKNQGSSTQFMIPNQHGESSGSKKILSWNEISDFFSSNQFSTDGSGKVKLTGLGSGDDAKLILASGGTEGEGKAGATISNKKIDPYTLSTSDNTFGVKIDPYGGLYTDTSASKSGIGVKLYPKGGLFYDETEANLGIYVGIRNGLIYWYDGSIAVDYKLTDYTNNVNTLETYTNRVIVLEGYTNRVVTLESYTNRVIELETYTNTIISATNRITILESYTNAITAVDSATNTLYRQGGVTNTLYQLTPYTNIVIATTNTVRELTTYTNIVIETTNVVYVLTGYTNTVVVTAGYTNNVLTLETYTNTFIVATNDIADLKGRKYIPDMLSVTTNDTEASKEDPKNQGKFQLVGFSAAADGSDKLKIPYVEPKSGGGNSLAWQKPIQFFDTDSFSENETDGTVQLKLTRDDGYTTILGAKASGTKTVVDTLKLDGGSLVADSSTLKVKAKANQGIGVDSTKDDGGVYVKIGNGLAFGSEGSINVIDDILNATNRITELETYTNRVVELETYTNRIVALETYTNTVIDVTNRVFFLEGYTNTIIETTNIVVDATNRIYVLESYTNVIATATNTLNEATNTLYKIGGVTNTIQQLIVYTNIVTDTTNILYRKGGITNTLFDVERESNTTTNFLYGISGFTNMFTRIINLGNGFDNASVWTNGDALVEIKGWNEKTDLYDGDTLADYATNNTETVYDKERISIVTRIAGEGDANASVGYLDIGDFTSMDDGFGKFVKRQKDEFEKTTPYIRDPDTIIWDAITNIAAIVLDGDRLADYASIKTNGSQLLEVAGYEEANPWTVPMKVEDEESEAELRWVMPIDCASIYTNEQHKFEINGFSSANDMMIPVAVSTNDDTSVESIEWKPYVVPDSEYVRIFGVWPYEWVEKYSSLEWSELEGSVVTGAVQIAGFANAETNTVPVKVKISDGEEEEGAVYGIEWRDIGAIGGATTFVGTDGSRATTTGTNTVTFAAMEDSNVKVTVTTNATGVLIKFGVYWK